MDKAQLAAKMLHAIGPDMDFFWANAHPDLVLEYPFAPWVGRPERVTGRENTEPHLDEVVRVLPGMTFTDVRVMPLAEPDAFLLEYTATCPQVNDYRQPYITIMRFKDDKLILFREYWDSSEIIRAFAGTTSGSTT